MRVREEGVVDGGGGGEVKVDHSIVAVQPTIGAAAVDAADVTHMIDTRVTVFDNAGDMQVEVIRKCMCAVMSTPKRLKKVMQKLNKDTTTTGLCKQQFVQMIMLCVNRTNKDKNEVDDTLQVDPTTIDAMWVLIQPMQVNDHEEISAELLGAWLYSKVEGKSTETEICPGSGPETEFIGGVPKRNSSAMV